jgi:hypothetical protein
MPTVVRIGARASIADDQRPLGRTFMTVLAVDDDGREVLREIADPDPLVVDVAAFADLADGRRVPLANRGGTLDMPPSSSVADLREYVRQFLFDDDCSDEPDDEALASLPFVVDVDPDLAARLERRVP